MTCDCDVDAYAIQAVNTYTPYEMGKKIWIQGRREEVSHCGQNCEEEFQLEYWR